MRYAFPEGGGRTLLESSRRILALTAELASRRKLLALVAAGAALAIGGVATAQTAEERHDGAQREDRNIDPVTGKICQPMCAEDMSPCDPPIMKAREGRCSSPSAGFVG